MSVKKPSIRTPKGVAIYPWVSKPDTKFDPDGKYRLTLRVADDDPLLAELQKTVLEFMNAFVSSNIPPAKAGPFHAKDSLKFPWQPASDKDESKNEVPVPGFTDLSMSAKHVIRTEGEEPKTIVLKVQDARGKDVTGKYQIGGGSTLRAVVTPFVWGPNKFGAGVGLRLELVRILELVEFKRAEEAMGDEEEGFAAPDEGDAAAAMGAEDESGALNV